MGDNDVTAAVSSSGNRPTTARHPVTSSGFSSVWIVAESERTCNFLRNQLAHSGIITKRTFIASEISKDMSQTLTTMHAERPDFVWISSLHHDSTHPLDDRTQTAAKLLITEQHSLGGEFLLENVSQFKEARGIPITSEWQAANHRGTRSSIWWCALGLIRPGKISQKIKDCAYVNVFTSLHVPQSLNQCCTGNSKVTGRSLLPARLPKSYYAAMSLMVHDGFTNNELPNTAEIYKTQRKQKPKPPVPTTDETPGDHADTEFLEKPSKKVEMENTYDDCGDDVSTIMGEQSYSSSCFDELDSDSDDEEIFDDAFFTWGATGSTTCTEEPLHERPNSLSFLSMASAYAALGHNPKYAGQHDVMELFGGDAGTSRVCIRRGLKTGPSFDLNIGIDLTNKEEVDLLWRYLERHRPKVIIAGPPCTSFGAWSRINRHKSYDTWVKSRRIGELLANLTAEVCWYQLLHHRHFVVENPLGSEIWQLTSFSELLEDDRVAQAVLDQCQVGLVDPNGEPTMKPTLFIASCNELIRRLRIRCPGNHQHTHLAGSAHGIRRCAFAQVWPRRLVELLAEGIVATLKLAKRTWQDQAFVDTTSAYPDVEAAPATCPGCRTHARRDDRRHSRVPGVCRFPLDAPNLWDCDACQKHKPSTHAGHRFDETCQWTDAPSRKRGAERVPGTLRDPKVKTHIPPEVAPADQEINMPIAPEGLQWTPVTDLEVITELDVNGNNDGWHGSTLTWTNGRALRSPEPRFDGQTFKWRSSFAYFPDCEHAHGRWWQLENMVRWSEQDPIRFGYPIPILIQAFHRQISEARPQKIIPDEPTTDERTSSSSGTVRGLPPKSNPLQELLHKWGEDDGDEPPPVVPNPVGPAELQPEEINIIPEWSNYDLGASLRALRSDSIPQQNRALRRLHVRWWHASTVRMESLLRAAGVSADVIKKIAPTVESCSICRMWMKPGRRSMVTTRIAEKFGESVQMDLLFVESCIILHLIDENIRWTATALIPDRNASTVLHAITTIWLKIFGPMQTLVSDQEGALSGDEAAIWAERWKINLLLKAKGQHSTVVERHHQILREHLRKILAQLRMEKLSVGFDEALSEATFVKNAMLQIAGTTPYIALFGRFPQVLAEFEAQGQSALTDADGGVLGASRHSVRLREIAVMTIAQAQAENRIKQAEHSKTRVTGQLLDLRCGDLCDLFRQPQNKDLTGWRGPAEVVDTSTLDRGFVSLRWGGRTMSVRLQDLRRSSLFVGLTDEGSYPLDRIRQYLLNVFNTVQTMSWVFGAEGWKLSRTAQENPEVFVAILSVALNELALVRCLGARLGRGTHMLQGLSAIDHATLLWWPASRPQMYRTLQHSGNQTIHLKLLFDKDPDVEDVCWVQFLSTTPTEARKLRRRQPDVPLLAPDPDDDNMAERYEDDASTIVADWPSTVPMDSNQTMPYDPPDQDQERIHRTAVTTGNSARSRSERTASSKHPSPVVSRDAPRRSVPSGAEDNTTKRSKSQPDAGIGASGSSSSGLNHGTENNTSIPATPLLPIHEPDELPPIPDDDDLDSEATHDYGEYLAYLVDETVIMNYLAEDGTSVISKDLSELSSTDVNTHWDLVVVAIRKELASFAELGAWKLVNKGNTGNSMTSRWVHRWKMLLDATGHKTRGVKSRLTVHGFKDNEANTLLTYASTASRWAQRMIVAEASQRKWHIMTADVGNAFLRSLTFADLARITGTEERRVAFVPPKQSECFFREIKGLEEFDVNKHELLMVRAVYGLKDAPRAWRITLHLTMDELKGKALRTDVSIYYWHSAEGELMLLVSAHVDDLKITGELTWILWFLAEMTWRFGALKEQWNTFEHCGLEHVQDVADFSVTVSQDHYAQRLKTIDMTTIDVTKPEQLLSKLLHEDFLSLLGGISWLSQTRLDVVIFTQSLQRSSKTPRTCNLVRLNAVVKWVKRKSCKLKYIALEGRKKVGAISDAAFRREDLSGLAMRGAIVARMEQHHEHPGGRIQVIEFYSRRQRRIVRSTFGAELNSFIDAFEIAKLLAFTLAELEDPTLTTLSLRALEESGKFPIQIEGVVDCRSIFDALRTSETKIPNEASLIMLLLSLKEALKSGLLTALWWCDTADMLSDGLNKGMVSRKALLETSASGVWTLKFPALKHAEGPTA